MLTIHMICGKGGTGKDTLCKMVLEKFNYKLIPDVAYTSRPMRTGEIDGIDYFFRPFPVNDLFNVVEWRSYKVRDGVWYYWHNKIDETKIPVTVNDVLVISTPDTIVKYAKAYGAKNIRVYEIVCSQEERFHRMVKREMAQKCPDYVELARRYLADSTDWDKFGTPESICESLGIVYHQIDGDTLPKYELEQISELMFPSCT